eukprot:15120705-Heterocapsa_arctica.AAC.1
MDHGVEETRSAFGYGVTRVAWSFLAKNAKGKYKTKVPARITTTKPPPAGLPGPSFRLWQ